jgi:hypothetical protein
MKKTFNFLGAFMLFSFLSFAQADTLKKTLIGGKINKIGLVGSVYGQFAGINGAFKPSGGGSVSFLFNERLGIGLSAYQFFNPNRTQGQLVTRASIAGVQLEYNTNPNKMVHFSFPLLIGAGSASSDSSYNRKSSRDFYRGSRGDGSDFYHSRNGRPNFAVIQPGVNVEVNVLKNMAVFGGVNYRIAVGSSSTDLSNKNLSGLGIQAGLKVGIFGMPVSKLKFRNSKNIEKV